MTQIEINNKTYFFRQEEQFLGENVTYFYIKKEHQRLQYYLFGPMVTDYSYKSAFEVNFFITKHACDEKYLTIIKQIEQSYSKLDTINEGKFKIN